MTTATLAEKPSFSVLPPDSLTGAICTGVESIPKHADVLCHWLAFNYAVPEGVQVQERVDWLLHELKPVIDSVEPQEHAFFGYSHAYKINAGALLMWNPTQPQNGIYLSIPGETIQTFVHGVDTIAGLVEFLMVHLGGRPTRVDFAFDDFARLLDVDFIRKTCLAGNLTTVWKTFKSSEDYQISSGVGRSALIGNMVTFGSRKSESYGRCYDKRLERLLMKQPCEHAHWVRFELELKGKKAIAAAELILKDDTDVLLAYLYYQIDFKTPNPKDSNKRRWASCYWWIEFTGNVKKLKLHIERDERSLEKVARWVDHQVLPSLALLSAAYGDGDPRVGIDALKDEILEAQSRLTAEHHKLLQRHLGEKRQLALDTDNGWV